MAHISTRTLVVVLLVLGVGLGLLTAGGVYITTAQAAAQQADQALATVIVPNRPVAARAIIQAGDVRQQQEHRSDVPSQAAVRLDDVVGKVALANLYAGAPVLLPQVAAASTARSLGYALPQGMEAMALPTPDLVSGAGAIAPGDRIDIILTVPAVLAKSSTAPAKETQFALQSVEVIGVGPVATIAPTSGSGAAAAMQGSLTVLVTPQQALLLTYAKDGGGEGVSINLVLRRPDDKATYSTTPVSLDYLRQALDTVAH